MEKILEKTPRIEAVDALRGFAVMAILLVHNLEHFIFPVYPEDVPDWLSVLDQGVFTVVFSLFAGKAYAIFALLFGFTFYIQSHNRKMRGGDFGFRFLWRLVLLAGFATLNAAFFPAGDVLLLFALTGVVLFIARNWSDRAVLAAALFFLLQPVEWYRFIVSLIDPSYRLPDLDVDGMYAAVAECTRGGGLREFLACNITLGQKASLLWAVDGGRLFQTAGLFLSGFYIGRKRLLVATEGNKHTWVGILIVSALAFAPLYSLKESVMTGDEIVRRTAGTAFDMWQKLAFASVLISSFVLLYRNETFRRKTDALRFYGRMSLTNYISQSVAGAIVYFPIGLCLAPRCGYTLSLVIGLCMFLLQVRFCRLWLGRHRQGPLEYVWHKWTWIGSDRG